MFTYVHPALVNCISATCTFDLWMSKGEHDVFVVVVNVCLTNGRPSTSLSNYLKCLTLMVQLWLHGYSNFWISFLLPKRSLLMLRMRVLIYRHVQAL